MKILITGALGQVGRATTHQAHARGMNVVAVDLPELDITDPVAVSRSLDEVCPDVLINAAAYTAVDRAEEESETAFAVNSDGPAILADACSARSIPLIHISTDYVFDGTSATPYRENDEPQPLGVYGASKLAGDERIRINHPDHVILRTSWVFSEVGANFVKTMVRLAREKEEIRVVDDQWGKPTAADDIARAMLDIAFQIDSGMPDYRGTFHFAGDEPVTWYGFARAIIDEAAAAEDLTVQKLTPIQTAEYPTPAARPAYSVLDCQKIERVFGIRPPSWRHSLRVVVESLHDGVRT